ncbi:kinase-like protein [Xylariaceae sp. FL0594]|nr:kinase-like protein [Xylariaceae sp. FL0594]
MELIPYSSREGQVVLRHRDALVIRDHASQRLEIRSAPVAECPTCKRPLRSPSPERSFDAPSQHDSWVDPQYFRMLQAGHDDQYDPSNHHHSHSNSVRRLPRPTLPSGSPSRSGTGGSDVTLENVSDAEFVSSASAPQEGARIRRDAFSPNYFRRFFVEERELGRGGKGVVLLVRHEIDGCPLGHFACKRVPVGDDHAWLEKVLVEVELLAALSHPNLVSYRHVWLEDVQIHRFGPSVACAFILQQYCNGGDLLRYIVGDQPAQTTKEQLKAQMRRRSKGQGERPSLVPPSQPRLPLDQIYSLFKDVTSGLAYLHSANYIHRDLKPSNCLLHHENGKLTCLISDFGEVQPSNAVRKSTGTTGTISYCAPEVLKRDVRGQFGNFTVKSDVFSLGMILYFLCFGRLPYRHANVVQEELEDIDQLREEIAGWKGFQDERRERPDLPSRLYQLLKRMLALDPLERPSAAEVLGILNHESTYGGLRGGPRSTSPAPLEMPRHRIQNLDSPMPPGTPTPEPSNQQQPYGSNSDALDTLVPRGMRPPSPLKPPSQLALDINTLQPYQARSSPRRRTHPMILTRSQERHMPSPSPSPSPSRSPSPDRSTTASRPSTSSSANHPPQSPSVRTPLLMPPPLPAVSGSLETLRYRAAHFARAHAASVVLVFKLALFLVKMASLTRVCWPFMVGLGVGVPLMCAAGLDLAVPSAFSRQQQQEQQRPVYGPMTASSSSSLWLLSSQGSSDDTNLRWGWKTSLILFSLHFVALWAASRWGSLCVGGRDDWVNW